MREGINLGVLCVAVDTAEAGKCVRAVDVHGTRATDTLTARASERQCRVDLVLDFNESVENLPDISSRSCISRMGNLGR